MRFSGMMFAAGRADILARHREMRLALGSLLLSRGGCDRVEV
jgi:hypothetical protein